MASLTTIAEQAKDCAHSFSICKENLPPRSSSYVSSIITELDGLARVLQSFWKAFNRRGNEPRAELVTDDLRTVSKSVQYTLKDIDSFFEPVEGLYDRGKTTRTRIRESYEDTWQKIGEHFATEGNHVTGCESLVSRLDTYNTFLDDLQARVEGDSPSRQFKDMQYRLEKLLLYQEKSLEHSLSKMSLNPPANPSFKKQSSWERRRPSRARRKRIEAAPQTSELNLKPKSRLPERISFERLHRFQKSDSEDLFTSEEDEDEFDYDDEDDELGRPVGFEYDIDDSPVLVPPMAPVAPRRAPFVQRPVMLPTSPLYVGQPKAGDYFMPQMQMPGRFSGNVTPSAVSSETNSAILERHWVAVAFAQARSSTPFRTTGSESVCVGEHMPGAISNLREDYEEILKLPFDDGKLQMKILTRNSDCRSRILLRQERGKAKIVSTQPVTSLRILRRDNCLQLCLPGPKRDKVVLWTLLSFPTYERMVLFWCAFLALKSQDEANPIPRLEDASLDGETCYFSGIIIDDRFKHALHIFRDKDSKGVRLQASALKGPLKQTPIWTAFITHQMASKSWLRRVESRKIHLQDLTRYVFTQDYTPQLGPRGEHELDFMSSKDAAHFYEVIEDIATGAIK